MEINVSKKEFLKAEQYIFTIANITKNGITGWNFYLYSKKGDYPFQRVAGGAYWNAKKGYYQINAWGTDRRLEILLSVGYSLGLDFHDIKQLKMKQL